MDSLVGLGNGVQIGHNCFNLSPEEAEAGVEIVDDATQRRKVAGDRRSRRRRRRTVHVIGGSSAVSIAAAVVIVVVGYSGSLVAQNFAPAQLRVFHFGAAEVSHLLNGKAPAAAGSPSNKKGCSQLSAQFLHLVHK